MNNLQIVDERIVLDKEFRIYGDKENPLFLAKDVANFIGHNKPSEMISNVDEDEKIKVKINPSDTIAKVLQSNTEYWFLTEEGIYEVLMQSRKPIAKQFKKEVKHILKSIRKHGAYMTENVLEQAISNPDMMIGLLQKLKEEQQKRKLEEEKRVIAEQKAQEKQVVIDTVINDNGIYSIGVVGKILKTYCDEMGAKKTFSYLRNEGILMDTPGTQRHNLPYDIFSKYFEVKYTTKDFKTFPITYFNGKGVKWFLERLVKRGLLTPREREEAKSKIG